MAFNRIKLRTFGVLNGALAKERAFCKACKFNSQALTDCITCRAGCIQQSNRRLVTDEIRIRVIAAEGHTPNTSNVQDEFLLLNLSGALWGGGRRRLIASNGCVHWEAASLNESLRKYRGSAGLRPSAQSFLYSS